MDSLKVLIVPDKFKGTLTAVEAAQAIQRGWKKKRPKDHVEVLPMSDGGDGFGEAVSRLLRCKPFKIKSVDAAHNECRTIFWFNEEESIAIVESAKVIGLAMLPEGQYHPFELDTFGLGHVLKKIAKKKPETLYIGLGGSATNDGGFGMASALGYSFMDEDGLFIKKWTELHKLERIIPPEDPLPFGEVIAAVDVKNPLLGKKGASRIYGPQKGLAPGDIPVAEKNLKRLAQVFKETFGKDLSKYPGAGAAGGLGFGLMAFLNARVESGFEIFSRLANIEEKIKASDIVITGEGSCDRSSLMGKGTGEIAALCRKYEKPCIMIAGRVTVSPALKRNFLLILSMVDICGGKDSMEIPSQSLEKVAEIAAKNMALS